MVCKTVENWANLERFINDGSPNKVSQIRSVSTPTHPMYSKRSFGVVCISPEEKCTFHFSGTHPNGALLNTFGIPIHPDCSKFLKPSYLEQYRQSDGDLRCTVSAAPRTMFVSLDSVDPYFIKLSYPMILGRFSSPLTRQKAKDSISLSNYIKQSVLDCDAKVSWFHETGFVSADLFEGVGPIGHSVCIFRDLLPFSKNGLVEMPDAIVPLFSLIARGDSTIVADFIEPPRGKSIIDYVWESILLPVIDSIFLFISEFGLIPEPHAQNVVLYKDGVSGSLEIAWRDALSFKILTRHERIAGIENSWGRTIGDPEIELVELSCMLDGMFDEYILVPLIAKVRAFCDGSGELRRRAHIAIHDWIGTTKLEFPVDGWYNRDSAPMELGQKLKPQFIPGKSGLR